MANQALTPETMSKQGYYAGRGSKEGNAMSEVGGGEVFEMGEHGVRKPKGTEGRYFEMRAETPS
jgi:hypothetical protein